MKPKKKIYFVMPSMAGGGAEKVINILLNRFNREKFTLKLILFNKTGVYLDKIPPDIEIIDLKKRNRWDFFLLILKIRRLIKEERPDILFSSLHYANIVTVLSGLFLRDKCKIVISEQNYHRRYLAHVRFKFLKQALIPFTYRKAEKIIVCANSIKQILIDDFLMNPEKIEVIFSPVEIDEIEKSNANEVSYPIFRNRENGFIIITAGRLTKQKNQKLLINSFASVRKKMPAFLVILGEGELEKELKVLVKQLGVEQYVDFVGFQKNLFSWLKASHLFALSSDWEGMPLVLIAAMACGLPVISTRCPSGPEEIITDGVNGLLVPVDDRDAMSVAILRLFKDKSLREQLAVAGRNRALDFASEKIVTDYENVFEEV